MASRPAPPDWILSGDPHRDVGRNELALRWLGTAGFEIRTAGAAILIDPFVSRPSLWSLLLRPVAPDLEAIARYVRSADAVFVGHSHYDHLLDAPTIALRTGARFLGSEASVRLARLAGVPDARLQRLAGGERVTIGDLVVEPVPGVHSRLFTQCLVGGAMPEHAHLPLWFHQYKNDRVFGFRITWRGRTLYHNGSADLDATPAGGLPVDLLLQCIPGWTASPRIFERVRAAMTPVAIVPMHHDDYFRPLEAGFRELSVAHLAKATRRIRHDIPDAAIVESGLLREIRLAARE